MLGSHLFCLDYASVMKLWLHSPNQCRGTFLHIGNQYFQYFCLKQSAFTCYASANPKAAQKAHKQREWVTTGRFWPWQKHDMMWNMCTVHPGKQLETLQAAVIRYTELVHAVPCKMHRSWTTAGVWAHEDLYLLLTSITLSGKGGHQAFNLHVW